MLISEARGPRGGKAAARATGRSPEEVGYYRIRTPVKPITVGELSELEPALAQADHPVEETCDEPD